jgi:hypothetical protein
LRLEESGSVELDERETAGGASARFSRSKDVLRLAAVDAQFEPDLSTLQPLPFLTRLWFAWVCFFLVLFDGAFAARARHARHSPAALPAKRPEPASPRAPEPPSSAPALQLLALLQREGRLVDFLKQDIAAFGDSDVGAVARVVHDGCRKALESHAEIEPIRPEAEGARLELARGFDASEVKLSGQVQGEPPYRGVLLHRGWRATRLELPMPVAGHNARVLAPAEVEL